MKKNLIFAMLGILVTTWCDAAIHRINNNVGISTDFTNFSSAQTAASNGDTLYLESSQTSYGNLVITKSLVIIGPGYFLSANPETQAILTTAKTGTINFSNGSAGTKLMGLEITGDITIASSNITLKHNYSKNIKINSSASLTNILISQNYIKGVLGNSTGSAQITNVIISNNIIYNSSGLGTAIGFPIGYSGLLSNNVIRGGNYLAVDVSNFNFTNNIVYDYGVALNNNTYFNNIGSSNQFPDVNNNLQYIDMSSVFVGLPGNSTDGQYQLAINSPAIGAGLEGTDCGVFGGITPYVLSGLPPVPAIYEVIMPSAGTSANGINVNVKAKVH